MRAKVFWKKKLKFEGFTDTGHKIIMDSVPANMPSNGPTPKELILQALAGCTMMTVISILQKARKNISKFWVEIDSHVSDEIPYAFEAIDITYKFIGRDLNEEFIEKAIINRLHKYCAVSAMLCEAVKISYSYEIIKSNA